MQWALALSLVLHIGAALVVIISSGFSTMGKQSANLIIQDISLSPSLSAPVKPVVTQPPAAPPEITTPPSEPRVEPEKTLPELTAEQQPPSPDSSVAEGGLISTPLGLGMTHGYFSSLADGRTLRDDIRSYYFDLVEKINREWWDKAGLLKEPLRHDGIFDIAVARDGTIVSIQMLQGTGSREADELIADSIRGASPLPSLPPTYESGVFRAPLRIKAPSFLFRLGS
ncbi:MAG: TonB C-terminal domain-containing protein [Desulfuromonadaceae bacterium]|nr:TonB C-terminal domain-containing protein [Desulfuromonadaceae bacterium]MDD5104563.1 TonB C-terminal domain-containing protein [Desulfuromonadaceae bacterium]